MFVFGRPLNPEELFDREEITRLLVDRCRAIKAGTRRDYALLGIRRIGKTSVLRKVIAELEKESICGILFDCQGLQFGFEELDIEFFTKFYGAVIIEEFLKKIGRPERIVELIKLPSKELVLRIAEFIGKIKTLKLSALEEWLSLSIEFEEKQALSKKELLDYFETTINLPERLGEEKKLCWVIAFDEFQFMQNFKLPGDLLSILRRNLQRHKRTSYIVSGSNIGMMKETLLNLKSPFGANFFVLWLNPFDRETSISFMKKSFSEEKITVSPGIIEEIVDFTGGNPAYLNWIGEKCTRLKKIGNTEIKEIEAEIFKPFNLGYLFERELFKLKKAGALSKTLAVVKAMAKYDLHTPSEIMKAVGRITTSNVINYLRRLEKYGYVEQQRKGYYKIMDPMLEKYIAETS